MLNVEERKQGDVTILDVEGNIIMGGGSAKLRDTVRRLIDEGRKNVLLNFAGVKYIDSSGIGELVSSQLALNRRGGQMKLANLPSKVEEVIDLSSLRTFFEIHKDEPEALGDFKNAS